MTTNEVVRGLNGVHDPDTRASAPNQIGHLDLAHTTSLPSDMSDNEPMGYGSSRNIDNALHAHIERMEDWRR